MKSVLDSDVVWKIVKILTAEGKHKSAAEDGVLTCVAISF